MDESNKCEMDRILTTACWFGLRDCLDLASEFFNKWMNNSKHEVPVCFSSALCCYGVWMGNEEEWEFLWKIFQKNDTKDAHHIFYGLSCTRIPRLLQRYLHDIHNDETNPPSDTAQALLFVVQNEIGYWTAWTFVTENWSDLPLRSITESLMIPVTTDIHMQMIQAFLNNTLEPEEKNITTDIMLRDKSYNEKRKKSMTKMIMWFKENMDK
uniref:ERAP1-like C-terminal domain-containing protein n=2 Tax=Micrurus corallinus TaxID=54390 RepID=A0A2D4H229_MICCO